MDLPLFQRAQEDGTVLWTAVVDQIAAPLSCGAASPARVPGAPGPGEQYRFHFDMTKCIGCKCCVVACNEQNGNPADILWRRVGEIEGGTYPHTQRHYLSMGCNHCLEPTCMSGCPVDAYSKDSLTGIVRHSADACIGCQYCTWNCSYGVPQFNPERGVVGKCDMCFGRLMAGQEPACAAACPEDAIRIEVVNVQQWCGEYRALANSPGMPSADDSLSTTRITLPKSLPGDLRKVDLSHLHPEHPHWPLIVMTVLTQMSVGAFTALSTLQVFGTQPHRRASLVALLVALLALTASTLHLGRPVHALRALKMWRRSWLSREVLAFTLFAASAATYSAVLWFGLPTAGLFGLLTAALGLCGVGASARLYMVPGRPAWNSPFTLANFFATTALLGSADADVLCGGTSSAHRAVTAATALVLTLEVLRAAWLARAQVHELRGAWQLLSITFQNYVAVRAVLPLAAFFLLVSASGTWQRLAAMLLLLAGEFTSRYLFFVSVVPTNMAREYLVGESA